MKKIISLVACALLALPFAQPALAQTPMPLDASEQKPLPPAEKSAATTDGIIVKFSLPEQLPAPEQQGTAQALGVAAMQEMSAAAGVPLAYERPMSDQAHVLRLPAEVPQAEAQAMADSIAQLPAVAYAAPVIHMQAMQMGGEAVTVPNDPDYNKQWHYFAPAANNYGINLPAAWSLTTGNAGVVVAVLDTGIRFDHPDLAGRTLAGYDMITDVTVANDGDTRDPDATRPG